MTDSVAWATLVAAADPNVVLPVRPRGTADAVPGPLQLRDVFELGDGHAVVLVVDGEGTQWSAPVIATDGQVRRARIGDGTAQRLIERLATSSASGSFTVTSWHTQVLTGERGINVDQTNESVVVGDRAVVKWGGRLPTEGQGGSVAPARIRTLKAAGFTSMPTPWALLEWGGGSEVLLTASVFEFVPATQDGWDWAVAEVASAAKGTSDLEAALRAPHRLGALTARMHLALASAGVDLANPAVAQRWADQANGDLDTALALLDGDEGERLRERAGAIRAAFTTFAHGTHAQLSDLHGDFHVGQILRTTDTHQFYVIDFDGNPVLTPHERAERRPTAVDVAGMIASLDHVGRVVIRRVEGANPHIVRQWIEQAQHEYLAQYTATLHEAGRSELFDAELVTPFRLQQECREFIYAVRHLPHWRYVADEALQDLFPTTA